MSNKINLPTASKQDEILERVSRLNDLSGGDDILYDINVVNGHNTNMKGDLTLPNYTISVDSSNTAFPRESKLNEGKFVGSIAYAKIYDLKGNRIRYKSFDYENFSDSNRREFKVYNYGKVNDETIYIVIGSSTNFEYMIVYNVVDNKYIVLKSKYSNESQSISSRIRVAPDDGKTMAILSSSKYEGVSYAGLWFIDFELWKDQGYKDITWENDPNAENVVHMDTNLSVGSDKIRAVNYLGKYKDGYVFTHFMSDDSLSSGAISSSARMKISIFKEKTLEPIKTINTKATIRSYSNDTRGHLGMVVGPYVVGLDKESLYNLDDGKTYIYKAGTPGFIMLGGGKSTLFLRDTIKLPNGELFHRKDDLTEVIKITTSGGYRSQFNVNIPNNNSTVRCVYKNFVVTTLSYRDAGIGITFYDIDSMKVVGSGYLNGELDVVDVYTTNDTLYIRAIETDSKSEKRSIVFEIKETPTDSLKWREP